MNIWEAIEQRRSVKHFDPTHVVSDEDFKKLMDAVLLSPTSFNIQNWRFVLVQDPDKRKELRKVAWNQAQITEASLCFVICADLKAWAKEPNRYWRNAPQEIQNILLPAIDQCYKNDCQLERDEAMRSAGIAAQTLMLAAKGMNLDSCPMVGFDFKKVADLIHLPPDHVVSLIVTVGKALKPARPRGGQLPLNEVLFLNHFPESP